MQSRGPRHSSTGRRSPVDDTAAAMVRRGQCDCDGDQATMVVIRQMPETDQMAVSQRCRGGSGGMVLVMLSGRHEASRPTDVSRRRYKQQTSEPKDRQTFCVTGHIGAMNSHSSNRSSPRRPFPPPARGSPRCGCGTGTRSLPSTATIVETVDKRTTVTA